MARLFVCREIVNQIKIGIELIDESIELLDERSKNAQYIYIYSLFESTLTETLRYYFTGFPEKMGKNITISKELLLSSPLTSIVKLEVINTYIRGYSSDSLVNYIKFYLNTMGIVIDIDVNRIQEISSIRNTIVHDNLKMSSALSYVASKSTGKLETSVLREGVLYLRKLLSEINIAVNEKYYEYTLERVCRTVWNETFSTPLLKFEDVWTLEKGLIHIRDFDKGYKKYHALSTAEKTLFAVFLQQYNNNLNEKVFKFRDIAPIFSLDEKSREKLIYIIQLFIAHPYLFNGEEFN